MRGAFLKVRTRSRDSTVLVVDDDDRARVATARMLNERGVRGRGRGDR